MARDKQAANTERHVATTLPQQHKARQRVRQGEGEVDGAGEGGRRLREDKSKNSSEKCFHASRYLALTCQSGLSQSTMCTMYTCTHSTYDAWA